jgi:competence protein ComEC
MGAGRPAGLVVLGIVAVVALALVHQEAIRERAEAALGRGMPSREAELARGFVLGEDEDIDATTVEDFRRAGLSHLLAVSGQNVALLGLLAMPLLAALGMSLRTRLAWILAAIVIYVPLAGGGPSILRAGVMGGLGLLATLAGRRSSRLYGLAVAAIVTLAIDPRVGADIGWQLSFAAVLGILVLASPLRVAIAARIGLAEGAAMTIAATVATAPLIAFHFESISTTSLLANLLALPAVAPAMWLAMLAAVGGQIPGFPVTILNAIDAPLLAYIAQVAAWCGRPSWAYLDVRLGGAGLLVSYLALTALAVAVPWLARRRRIAVARCASARPSPGRSALGVNWSPNALRLRSGRRVWVVAIAVVGGFISIWLAPGGGADELPPIAGLRVSVLDVGQGDAILLQPARAPAVLVDVARRVTISSRSCVRPGSSGSAPRSSLTKRPIMPVGSRSCSVASRLPSSLMPGSAGGCTARPRLPVPPPFGLCRAPRCAPAGCGSRFSGQHPSSSPHRLPAPIPIARPWSCSPAGATSRCCSAPMPRRRPCRSTRVRSMC